MRAKVLFFIFSFVVFSCSKKEKALPLPDENLLSLSVKWALVISPVSSLKKEASTNSQNMESVKIGDILQVKGLKFVDGEKWYMFENGFLEEREVKIYQNYFQAENAQKKMKEARRENDKNYR